MAISRKDSFLWGKAPQKLPPRQKAQSELPDDIQKLRLEIHPIASELHPDISQQTKNVARNRKFLRGKKKFNMSPKKGLQYLVDNGLLDHGAEPVAEFLYKEEGLNKTAIGSFLGEKEELNLETLKVFVGLHEFSDLNLVQALRQFLWSFRLPGEAQKIDRMMEAFATRYCECNHSVFQSTDTCYILSFAIIMLNTTLHNPNVKDKPNLQRFVSMNRGINNGEDLPTEMLTKLYASIRNEPLTFPEDDGNDLTLTFFNPDREGWLLKMGGRVKTWKRRWFILTDSCLYYFEYTTDQDPIGIIPLENLCVRKLQDSSKQYCLELYNPTGQKIKACKMEGRGGVVQGKHQSYTLSAASEDERDSWIHAISASVTKNPLYDLVCVRRRKVVGSTSSND
ncbi:cytohesin-4-like isoform X1 [Takifugu rubripes]|uniref:Cytohesin 4a n=1 Tax=Takifugu rubripes TaxID=31033 RepID=A0A3B5KCD3_TAKRU|nr:cytohesin-4-like isoform X1 [Takifugu rubripes]|eukprot:XP_003965052.1 PREDICTED: cytohesin-4-like [Takifugu rubripes]